VTEVDVGTLRGWIAVVTLLTFLGICWWAYRSANRARFEEDGLIPFLDEGVTGSERSTSLDGREGTDV
jgi:cytochrome c oxidase cbb3-type subunit 4